MLVVYNEKPPFYLGFRWPIRFAVWGIINFKHNLVCFWLSRTDSLRFREQELLCYDL